MQTGRDQIGKKFFQMVAATVLLVGCQTPSPKVEQKPSLSLTEVVGMPHRSAENRARDLHRHPVETLTFFGVQPEHRVLEVSPGKGWYSEILAPYLQKGTLILAIPRDDSDKAYHRANNAALKAVMASQPDLFGSVQYVGFEPPAVMKELAEPNSLDQVLTFRNFHNWVAAGQAEAALQLFHRALKPGGVLGVVDHRANPKGKADPKISSGYIQEAVVIKLAEKAGFKLVEKSEINANPRDNRNHPKGVWTLPPSFALGAKDRAKYEAIGESDRMTLKFVKVVK